MYEPIRAKSVHTMAGRTQDFPHRTREEELDIQLAGHLAGLLAVTDELRSHSPDADLDQAAERLARQIARLRGGPAPELQAVPTPSSMAPPASVPPGSVPPGSVPPGSVPGASVPKPTSAGVAGGEDLVASMHRRAHALAGRALLVAASRADTAVAILSAERMDAHAAPGETAASREPAGAP